MTGARISLLAALAFAGGFGLVLALSRTFP